MTTGRKRFIYTILLGILAGHFFCLVLGVEVWPFSGYPMYAKASNSEKGFKQWEVVGIPVEGGETEAFILPVSSLPRIASLNSGINRLLRARSEEKPEAEEHIQNSLRIFATMYYHYQKVAEEDSIPLQEVRLYRRTWARSPSPGALSWDEQEPKLEAQATLSLSRLER